MWSTYETIKRAHKLYKQEKEEEEAYKKLHHGQLDVSASHQHVEESLMEVNSKELEEVIWEEKHHFTKKRSLFMFVSFICLFLTQTCLK